MLEFDGCLVSLVTPFTDDMSSVSEVRLARLVRRLVAQGAQGFMVGSDAGEFGTLSHLERKFVLEVVLRESQNAVPVLAQCTAISTMTALDLAQHAGRHGARGVVMIPPFYGRYTFEEIQFHIKTIANYSDLPVILVANPELHPPEMIEGALQHRGLRTALYLGDKVSAESCTSPYPTTEEFALQSFMVSPLGMIDPDGLRAEAFAEPSTKMKSLARAMRTHGVARVTKALLEHEDFEIGPPRTPMQPISREAKLEILASMQSQEAA